MDCTNLPQGKDEFWNSNNEMEWIRPRKCSAPNSVSSFILKYIYSGIYSVSAQTGVQNNLLSLVKYATWGKSKEFQDLAFIEVGYNKEDKRELHAGQMLKIRGPRSQINLYDFPVVIQDVKTKFIISSYYCIFYIS